MTAIDLDTCTAVDVIAHAIALHRGLFAEQLEAQASDHEAYAILVSTQKVGRSGACAMSKHCRIAAGVIRSGDIGEEAACALIIASDTGPLVVALNIACAILEIPRHVRTALLVRHEDTLSQTSPADL